MMVFCDSLCPAHHRAANTLAEVAPSTIRKKRVSLWACDSQ